MKPREFWLTIGTHLTLSNIPLEPQNEVIHVREVVPIDWEKVWANYGGIERFDHIQIKELVEKQLRGEE